MLHVEQSVDGLKLAGHDSQREPVQLLRQAQEQPVLLFPVTRVAWFEQLAITVQVRKQPG